MKIAIEIDEDGGFFEFKAMIVENDGRENQYLPICRWMSSSRKEVVKKGLKSVKKILKGAYD